MKVQGRVRGLLVRGAALIALLAAVTVFVNLSWFDETLHPDLARLIEPAPVSMDGNAYPLIYGLGAADDTDPLASGREILQRLRERYREGERVTVGADEMEEILGGSGLDDAWPAELEGLACNSRLSLDCAGQLISEIDPARLEPRVRVLLARYEAILAAPRFEETQEYDVSTPAPDYRLLMMVGRLRLASSFKTDSTDAFLAMLAEDMDFWRTMLRDGRSLIAKMVALAGFRNDLEFASALLRLRELDPSQMQSIQAALRPFTRAELDIGEAFLSELRIALLSDKSLVIMLGDAPWMTRLTLQANATLNEYYRAVIVPMQLRASLGAAEFYSRQGYENLTYDVRAFPPPLFNLGGKLVLKQWVAQFKQQDYVTRTHDVNGRIALVRLQAEIAQRAGRSVDAVIRSSTHRNPYTDERIDYDARAGTIGFDCLGGSPNDVCSVVIGSGQR